jgi:hypothetical protein
MSIAGRVNVDIVFHDSDDATNSIKVIDVESSESQVTGKVAVIKGTAETSPITIQQGSTGYVDAAGQPVAFTAITRMGLQASREMTLEDSQATARIRVGDNGVAYTHVNSTGDLTLTPNYASGTATYTVFLYGT